MSANNEKQDLRIRKTRKALKGALLALLTRRQFDKISVNDLCEEAVVSRTAFYAHFEDKYALLRFTLEEIEKELGEFEREHTDSENIIRMNNYIRENAKMLKNLMNESNPEAMSILIGMLTKDMGRKIHVTENMSAYDHALVNFCAGGFASLLLWQLNNNFPMDSGNFGEYVDRLLKKLKDSGE